LTASGARSTYPPVGSANSVRELLHMWGNTRMVVLTAMCASIYAAVLIPFMVVPLIPGITHFRPANALPVVCSFLFGPAAAWGSAIGNVIGDFFAGIGPGDFFGFAGNFLYGAVPYRVWRAVTPDDPLPTTPGTVVLFVVVVAAASMLCATTVGFGLHLLGFVPFAVLANVILINNLVTSLVLAPLLLRVVYPRVRRARLLYADVVAPPPPRPVWRRALGIALLFAGTLAAFVLGNVVATGGGDVAALASLGPTARFVAIVLPCLVVAVLGLALL
jgi:energy-coupling factor transport system substrate-specific component